MAPASDGFSERWEGPGSGATVGDSATVDMHVMHVTGVWD
jgi:hypothetical protein